MNLGSLVLFLLAGVMVVIVGAAERPLDRGAAASVALLLVAAAIAGEVLHH